MSDMVDAIFQFGHDPFYRRAGAPRGYFSDPEDDFDPGKTCRCCGKNELAWGQHKGKWRLHNRHGGLHQCSANPLRE